MRWRDEAAGGYDQQDEEQALAHEESVAQRDGVASKQ